MMALIRENTPDLLVGGGLMVWFNDYNIPVVGDELDLRGEIPAGKMDGIWRVARRRIGRPGEDEQAITLYLERVV